MAETIAEKDWPGLRDELGDLLFQVVFYAQMASERGLFDFVDVVTAIADKMERRHPHVFGTAKVESAAAQTRAWEAEKAAKRRVKAIAPARERSRRCCAWPARVDSGSQVASPGSPRRF